MNASFAIVTLLAVGMALATNWTLAQDLVPPGGVSKLDENQYEMVLPSLHAHEREMNKKMKSAYLHRIGRISKVESQVVAGMRFYVTFDFVQTVCPKAPGKKRKSCKRVPSKSAVCHADIWIQVWTNTNELLDFKCD